MSVDPVREVAFIEERNRWLAARGLLRQRGERPGEHVKRLADFCRTVSTIGGGSGDKDWARNILRDHAAGIRLPRASLAMAMEAHHVSTLPQFGSARLDARKASGTPRTHSQDAVTEVDF